MEKRFKFGDPHPERPGFVFDCYLNGVERWFSAESHAKAVARKRAYAGRNREAIREAARKRYHNGGKAVKREYAKRNRDRIQKAQRQYRKHRYATDPAYRKRMLEKAMVRLKTNPMAARRHFIRCRTGRAVRACMNGGNRVVKVLNATLIDLKNWIEAKWQSGMGWHNYGEWEIDHIVPLSAADTIEEIDALGRLHNIQPTWVKDNVDKGATMPGWDTLSDETRAAIPEGVAQKVRFGGGF